MADATPWAVNINKDINPDTFKGDDQLDMIGQAYKEEGNSDLAFNLNGTIANLQSIITDIAAGDKDAMKRPEFSCLNWNAIRAAIKWLNETDNLSDTAKVDLATNAWRLNFKCKPPTPEEFLTEKYIGPTAESIYAPVKKAFLESMDFNKPYRTTVLSCCIGWGKSLLTVLTNLYIATHFAMMWHPYKFFGQSASSVYTQVLCGWNQKKASELLLEPFMNILETSPYFVKSRTHGELIDQANDNDIDKYIYWTTATKTSALQMQNGVNFKIASSPGGILGQTIISGSMSELSFFVDEGWTEDNILKFFTKMRKRIDSRMNGNIYGRFILDSSPNTLESCIDKWIWEDAPKDPKNYIITGSTWKHFPNQFKKYYIDYDKDPKLVKKDFVDGWPLFRGGNGSPPQVIEVPAQLDQFDPKDILWCPTERVTKNGVINLRDSARENPIEFIRDWCGIPTSSADRIFYDAKVVEDIFDNNLKNVYGGLDIPASEEPEHLIWNKVKGLLFNKVIDKYYFYYEPNLPRVASIDLAISGDVASISVSHVERSKDLIDATGNPAKIYVTDFAIPVIPKNSIINLDAFKFFLLDLRRLGNMNIRYVSFDGFQSRSIMQSLQRNGFNVQLLSVDKQNEPYQSLIDYAFHRRWKCGKSVMMKNNLLSLEISTRKTGTKKIDHKNGEENCYADEFCPLNGVYSEQSWRFSKVGYCAKDLTDCVAANITLLDEYDNEFLPITQWDPQAFRERTYDNVKEDNLKMREKLGFTL